MIMARRPSARPGRPGRLAVGCLAVLALVATLAAPAPAGATAPGAPTPGATAVSITVLPGPLSISAPAPVGPLTRGQAHARQATLGRLKVEDGRAVGSGASWVASITWSAFRSPVDRAVGAAAVTYLAGEVTQVGMAVYTQRDLDPRGLGEPTEGQSAVGGHTVTAAGVRAGNLAVWDPTLRVTAPGSNDGTTDGTTDSATYTVTITYSVL